MAGRDEAGSRSIGVAGIGLVLLGVVALLVSFTAPVDWYPGSTGPSAVAHIRFSDLHHLTAASGSVAIAKAYFGWLAWVLLIVLIIVGFAANMPTPAADGLRVLGFVVGLAGAAVTYVALNRLAGSAGSGGAFEHSRAGVWLAVTGYLVAGVGAAVGPKRDA
jgi:hypothetical protein